MLETKLSRHLVNSLQNQIVFTLPYRLLKKLHYAFNHSHLTFGLPVWSATPNSNLSKLQKIQNKAIRLLAGVTWRDHASPLYAQSNILSMDKLVLPVLASFIHKYHLKKLRKNFDNIFTLVSSIYSRLEMGFRGFAQVRANPFLECQDNQRTHSCFFYRHYTFMKEPVASTIQKRTCS